MALSKIYIPSEHEPKIYDLWDKSDAFKPSNKEGAEVFSMVMPPPNANGKLHSGHAYMLALEDVIVRFQRMQGKSTLWLPGADHAGFETQVVYEKQLAKEGKSRFDFTRDELYKRIWDFVAANRDSFEVQFRKLGVSADWDHYTYTLDDKIVKTAYNTFQKMWQEGLIYRGERLVNYCTFHRTGFADIEVEYKEVKTPLYYMKYGPFELATTRPETKFGDTAVAVHPGDKRYAKWVGKTVQIEGVNGPFEVRVVADEMVDPKFGTGVVKVTPAHSFDDWEVAQRHNLPAVRVIDHDGTLNHKAGRFAGMTVLEARKAVAQALEDQGLMIKIDQDYKTRVGFCYKCGTIIEPMLMEQWFVDMKPLARGAINVLRDKKIKFYPDSKRTQLIGYLEDLKDWNISRQIAWGIPIPAFQNINDSDDWIYDERVGEETIVVDGKTYRRDPDVFDTWFSSSSWPYATLDYPTGKDYKKYYPNSLMETGGEILYPWVSRMIMMGLYVTGKIPFEAIYIHGHVMAQDGAKMSKSLGNVIDPLEAVDQYGSDALRMGLIAGRVPGVNRGYDPRKVEDARNFSNKLWNIARFIQSKVGPESVAKPEPKSLADNWMLSKLHHSTRELNELLSQYRFAEGYDLIYHLVWDDLADWYVEASKVEPNEAMLLYSLQTVLQLTHPFAPFVTETIWQAVHPGAELNPLIKSAWPQVPATKVQGIKDFEQIQALVNEVRFVTSTLGLGKATIVYDDSELIEANTQLIAKLANLSTVKRGRGQGIRLSSTKHDVWLDVDNKTTKSFVVILKTKRSEQEKVVIGLNQRLQNKSYVANAPQQIVEETKDQLKEAIELLAHLTDQSKHFN